MKVDAVTQEATTLLAYPTILKPGGIAVDSAGNLYVSSTQGREMFVIKVMPAHRPLRLWLAREWVVTLVITGRRRRRNCIRRLVSP